MVVHEGIGLLAGIVVLAGLTYAIANGSDTAKILGAGAGGFATMIRAARGQ